LSANEREAKARGQGGMELEVIVWRATDRPVEAELRRRLEEEGFSVWAWRDKPGATYEPHKHDEDESIWVVEGRIAFGVGGREYPLVAGDRLMLPKETVHTAVAGAEGAFYLIGERRA
jgi:quercetin dioxygenase-like cupin family protein